MKKSCCLFYHHKNLSPWHPFFENTQQAKLLWMKDSRSDFYEEISCFAKLNRAVECQLVIEVPLKKNKISITLVIKKEAKRYTNESSFVMSQGLFFFFFNRKTDLCNRQVWMHTTQLSQIEFYWFSITMSSIQCITAAVRLQ